MGHIFYMGTSYTWKNTETENRQGSKTCTNFEEGFNPSIICRRIKQFQLVLKDQGNSGNTWVTYVM